MAERFVFDDCRRTDHGGCPGSVTLGGTVVAVCACDHHASREGQSEPTLSSQPTEASHEPLGPD